MNVLLSLLLLSSLTVSVQAQQDTVEAHIEFCSGAAGEPAGCTKKLTFTTVTQQAPSYNNAPVGREVTVSLVRDHTLYEDEVVSGTLVTPLSATVRQSPMQQEYQEVYLRDFYGSYTEKASYGALLFVTCTYNGTPPCGPYRTVQGVEVEQNVGLCCQCLLCGNLIDCAGTRRDACNINSVRIVFTCWDPSPDIYEGYQLTKAPLYDALTVEIQGNSMNLTTELPEVTAGGVTVTLVESIAPPVSVRDVSPLYFFAAKSGPAVAEGPQGWFLLDPSLVSVDGNTCNAVGTSVEYFYSLGEDACMEKEKVCKSNQLDDYKAADRKAVSEGKAGRYMSWYMGAFRQRGDRLQQSLGYTATSQLRWVMSADDLAVTPAAAPGNLRNVTLLGNAREATLTGTITNTGNVSSAFTFAVQGCTPGGFVPNPPSVTLMMRPNTSLVYTHTLHAVTDVMEGVLICFVELTDSIGTSLDVFLQPWEYVTTTTTTTTTSTTTSTSTSTSSTSTTSTTSTTAAPNTSTTLSPAGPGLQGCNACAITHIACLFQSRCPWPLLLWVFVIEVGLTVLWGLVYWRQSFLPCVFKRKNTTK